MPREDLRASAAYARDEFEHAVRTLLLSTGCRQSRRFMSEVLYRDVVGLAVRLGAAALRADRVARGMMVDHVDGKAVPLGSDMVRKGG
jgi:hypothetical protein